MSEDDRIVWRYMDLAKYVGILSRGLFFARAVLAVTEAFGISPKVVGEAQMGRTPPDRIRFRELAPRIPWPPRSTP